MERKNAIKVAGVCGVIVPVVAFSCIFIAISMSPWFSWTVNALSDLGVGEAAWVFNSGLVSGGILAMVFAAGLFAAVRGRVLARVGAALFFIDAFALFGIGLFPVTSVAIHTLFSVAFLLLFPISLFLFGASEFMAGFKRFGSLTVGAGILSSVPWFLNWDGIAVPQTLSALTASVWVMVEGARLYLDRIES